MVVSLSTKFVVAMYAKMLEREREGVWFGGEAKGRFYVRERVIYESNLLGCCFFILFFSLCFILFLLFLIYELIWRFINIELMP